MKNILILLFLALSSMSCMNSATKRLPILGRHEFIETDSGTDTVYHQIKSFSFIDQDSAVINNETFSGKIYVADFFFTSCPSICPIMKAQMLRVYDQFEGNDKVMLLSHTIDPEYDNVSLLHSYAQKLGVKSNKWHFVTGDKSAIYDMAQTSYYVATRENEKAPGGYEHSGAFILVDNQKRIRGVYDGTKIEAVDKLLGDISILLNEADE